MKKVSVLMPVYNTEETHLREAIESILRQTFTDFEFIIADDGSITPVREVVASYRDQRIRYVENETNQGEAVTRNRLFSESQGVYLAITDADDIYLPERLQTQVDFLDAHPDIAAAGSWFMSFPECSRVKPLQNPGILDLLRINQFGHPTMMLRRSLIETYGFTYDTAFSVGADYELWSRIIRTHKMANIPVILVHYRNHKNGTSKLFSSRVTENDKRIRENLLEYLTSDPILKMKMEALLQDCMLRKKSTYCLFKNFPWLTMVQKREKTKWLLFGCIPILYRYVDGTEKERFRYSFLKKLAQIIPRCSIRRAIEKQCEKRRKKDQFLAWTSQDQQRTDFYRQFVSPNDLVFDVGANLGNRSKVFARLDAAVVAVEPQEACADFLEDVFHNRRAFHLVRKALGAAPGKTEMHISNAHTISSLSADWIASVKKSGRFPDCTWNGEQTVEIDTLDRLIAQYGRPVFIKIDVEGFEDQVIAGLSTRVRALSIEFTPEFIESTFRCIEHLCQLGPAEFQISLGESMEFFLANWVSRKEVCEILPKIPQEAFGDVYVRFPNADD